MIDRFDELIGLERLALVHLNDSRSLLGSRTDRHEHVGAGRIGPIGLGALLRDPRLRETTFIMETPGADEGWDAVNMRRAWMLWGGATELPVLPPKAFRTNRRSTRVVRALGLARALVCSRAGAPVRPVASRSASLPRSALADARCRPASARGHRPR